MTSPGYSALVLSGILVSQAGARGSAGYTVCAETLDCAGGAASSSSYQATSSLGGTSGPPSGAPAAVAQAGYIAQLAPVTGIALTTPAAAVDETGTLRLAAWEMLADGTRAGLPASAVTWTAASGPLTPSPGGVFTGAPVLQDAATRAGAAYGGFLSTIPLVVLNTTGDNFGSYAGDGLPDDWQARYFGMANPDASPSADPDGDGYSNLFEWAARLDPGDPGSRFHLSIRPVYGHPGRCDLTFGPLREGPVYQVWEATDLRSWKPLAASITTDAGVWRTVTDLAAVRNEKFYRVAVTGTGTESSYGNDGISDDWQIHYFGAANPAAAPDADPDHDGQNNAFEFAAELDPVLSSSRFSLAISAVPGRPNQRRLDFAPCADGPVYTVQAGTDLLAWSPLSTFSASGSGTQRTVVDLAALAPATFYRVAITGTGRGFAYTDDGLPDDWQEIHFGSFHPDAGPACDPDGDGQDNAFEYAAGLDPRDPASRLVVAIEPVPGRPASRKIVFYPRHEGSTHVVESSADLSQWAPLDASSVTVDDGLVRAVIDLAPSGNTRFYRVGVSRP